MKTFLISILLCLGIPALAADVKITDLPALTNAISTDVFPMVSLSGTPITKKITLSNLNKSAMSLNESLKALVSSGGYELTVLLRDRNDVVTNATVLWPDGTYGVFLCTSNNPTWLAVDAYTITYTNTGKTITQSTVLRNLSGAVTNKPALTITP